MTNPKPDQPEQAPQAEEKQRRSTEQATSPHEKAPPENPPIDDYDFERGKAKLDRVITK